ncbi:hypothetical protein ABIC12_001541 [Pantoea agglomerans]|nr:hypothetical protein [Pantoea agglomerans]
MITTKKYPIKKSLGDGATTDRASLSRLPGV